MLRNKAVRGPRRLDLAPGDTVVVVAGKDKGKHGEVLRTLPQTGKIVVKGVNILKRHTKANTGKPGSQAYQGGVVDFEAPFDYSNVMLLCPGCSRPTRIRHAVLENEARAMICVHCGHPYERVRVAGTQ